MLYERLLRPLLFRMDPETAHERAAAALRLIGQLPLGRDALALSTGSGARGLETSVLGLRFPNPIGLAAGFDKDCRLAGVLPALGFGFLELGSITLRPQPGNPRPRLFRLPEQEAVINRMGFNSGGAAAAVERMEVLDRRPVPIGINLGLNAKTPPDKAAAEYAETFRLLEPHGDYFVVNVSSPNTEGLRALQDRLRLSDILAAIAEKNHRRKPVLVKLDPDGDGERLEALVTLICAKAQGIVASNTTLSRDGVPSDAAEIRGGLSGQPLRRASTDLIRRIRSISEGKLPIIGAGGVSSGADAFEKIRAGASLVQLYTGLVYRGPGLVKRACRELSRLLSEHGFSSVAEAVGTGE